MNRRLFLKRIALIGAGMAVAPRLAAIEEPLKFSQTLTYINPSKSPFPLAQLIEGLKPKPHGIQT